jgi:hypothetical protein
MVQALGDIGKYLLAPPLDIINFGANPLNRLCAPPAEGDKEAKS